VYLDPELVHVDSVAFMRQATAALESTSIAGPGLPAARLYAGRFAPEFEYEDWADSWRTLVHAQFLRLSQLTAGDLLKAGQAQAGIEVLTRAVEIDGMALDLRGTLIRALMDVGSIDAAHDHYRQYASIARRELGTRAPSLEILCSEDWRSETLWHRREA
jgi:DNA-binding SARP family transcriptional activator